MNQTGTAQDKWAQTGWRIEQKYANKVLLGNWAEERLQVGILSAYCLFHFYPLHSDVTFAEGYQKAVGQGPVCMQGRLCCSARIKIRCSDLSIQLRLKVRTRTVYAFSCCRSKT